MAKTTKTCEVMQYLKYMDCPYDEIIERVRSITNIKTWCIILHDKDVLPDGRIKEPHFHAVLTFSDGKTWESIAKAFHIEKQYVNKIRTTTRRAQAYLIHKNDKDKYQYPVSEVQANFDYAELMEDTEFSLDIKEVIKKIEKEEIKPYNIAEAVDAYTYAIHKQKFDRAFEYVQSKKRSVNRDMECIYIYGEAGTGKTSLAKHLAAQKGYHIYVSSGGKNPLDNYAGEECIILDDLRGNVFPLADFLKLTDNNTDSLVGCRYYNKSIAYCRLIICTSVMSLDELYNGVTDTYKEPLKQLYRRFREVIQVDDRNMKVFSYSEEAGRHVYIGTTKNPVAMFFNPIVARETVQQFMESFGMKFEEPVEDSGFQDLKDEYNPFFESAVSKVKS